MAPLQDIDYYAWSIERYYLKDDTEEWLSWSKAPDLKSDVGENLPWVRILPLPPICN